MIQLFASRYATKKQRQQEKPSEKHRFANRSHVKTEVEPPTPVTPASLTLGTDSLLFSSRRLCNFKF